MGLRRKEAHGPTCTKPAGFTVRSGACWDVRSSGGLDSERLPTEKSGPA